MVLVHSASGGVGSALASLLRHHGAALAVGTVGRPEKVPDALTAGYAAAVARGPGLVEAVFEATGGRKVDVVLDPHGTDWLDADLELLAPGGRVVLFGNAAGGGPDLLPPVGRLIGGNASVAGFSHRRLAEEAPATIRAAMSRSIDLWARATSVSPRPLWTTSPR